MWVPLAVWFFEASRKQAGRKQEGSSRDRLLVPPRIRAAAWHLTHCVVCHLFAGSAPIGDSLNAWGWMELQASHSGSSTAGASWGMGLSTQPDDRGQEFGVMLAQTGLPGAGSRCVCACMLRVCCVLRARRRPAAAGAPGCCSAPLRVAARVRLRAHLTWPNWVAYGSSHNGVFDCTARGVPLLCRDGASPPVLCEVSGRLHLNDGLWLTPGAILAHRRGKGTTMALALQSLWRF